MLTLKPVRFLIVLGSSALLTFSQPARADLVSSVGSDFQALGGGLFQYTYSLKNLPASTLPVVSFSLDFGSAISPSDIQTAPGFTSTYQSGATSVSFNAPISGGVFPAGSTGTFSFQSTVAPGSQSYVVIGFDGSNFDTNFGNSTPAETPEPSGALLLGIGQVFLLGWIRRRRQAVAT